MAFCITRARVGRLKCRIYVLTSLTNISGFHMCDEMILISSIFTVKKVFIPFVKSGEFESEVPKRQFVILTFPRGQLKANEEDPFKHQQQAHK